MTLGMGKTPAARTRSTALPLRREKCATSPAAAVATRDLRQPGVAHQSRQPVGRTIPIQKIEDLALDRRGIGGAHARRLSHGEYRWGIDPTVHRKIGEDRRPARILCTDFDLISAVAQIAFKRCRKPILLDVCRKLVNGAPG
jgi:hypothetical protein